jgi:CHAT domain
MSCDLELEITPGAEPGQYIVTVDSPAGTASGQLRLDAKKLLRRRPELASAVLASAVPTRGVLSAQERPVREVGQQLFAAVFAQRVYGRYTASVQEAARRGEPLRVVLRLRAPELAGLPWEAMFDPETDEYLCQREPIVRYVETAQPANPLQVKPPLRVLGLVSAPSDLPTLDVEEEKRRLTHAIDDLVNRRQVELTWAPGGTWPCLQEVLLDGDWHVLHFIGHGGVNRDTGVLALEDELTGQANLVSSARFARLLHTCRPVPRLVVLNSCQSGEAAADDLLSSTAAALVHSGISASVAMQFAVTDPAALAFSRGFYQALAHAHPVDEAVRLGRIAIDGTSENTLEWVTPVLFLRTGETRLFSIIRPDGGVAPAQPAQPSPEQAERESTRHGLYMQALAAMRTGRDADAITLLDSLLALEPGYRDAADRRDAARRNLQLAAGYERARAAEDAGNWATAVAEYEAMADPGYRDVSERLADCARRRQIAGLHEELRNHVQAGEWRAVIAVCDELTAIGATSTEVDRAAKTARQQIQREEAADRAKHERAGQQRPAAQPGPADEQSPAARPAAVADDRPRHDQPGEGAGTASPRAEARPSGEKWRILYASRFPVLGSTLITAPLAILIVDTLISGLIFHTTPFRVMMVFGLAAVVGSAIDYRSGCGVPAVAVGVNALWFLGYAAIWPTILNRGTISQDLQSLFVITVIGLIGNGLLLIYISGLFPGRRKQTIATSLLLFLLFMTAGFASFSVSAGLVATSFLWLSGTIFSAALLAIVAGIVLTVTQALQRKPPS